MAALFDVRPDERRHACLAFLSLLGVMVAHTLIETARDTLLLVAVPTRTLPVLYLVIAATSLGLRRVSVLVEARAERAGARGRDPIAVALLVGAGVTAVFWLGTTLRARPILYALYVWSGLFGSWAAGRLWARLAVVFTAVQAKRLYGIIGTGAVLGAVLGAVISRVCLEWLDIRHLLLLGALLLVATALGPAHSLPRATVGAGSAPGDAPVIGAPAYGSPFQPLLDALQHPYLVRVLGLVLLASSVGTAVDFAFKSQVAHAVSDPHELARWLATVSIVTNVLSLVVQAVGVGVAMRVLGVHRALYVLPVLLAVGAGLGTLGLGVGAAVALRVVDGTLRQSLQKTSVELLCVPLPDALRARVKPLLDLVGHRGGQALMSVLILALVSGSPDLAPRAGRLVAGGVLLLSVGWVALAWSLRSRYLDVFRTTLRRGRIELPPGLPTLDLTALEVLLASLNSRHDEQVLAALELLAEQSRGRLVPAHILLHSSRVVVLRALELLAASGRADVGPVVERLLDHADVDVRAAAVRARAAVEPDAAFLRALLADPAEAVRATALVALVARGDREGSDAALGEAIARGPVEVRRALARAIGQVQVEAARRPCLERALLTLAADENPAVRACAATAMGHLGAPGFVPVLIGLLENRRAGLPAIESLAQMGDAAVEPVDAALDADVPDEIRWRLLRVLSLSGSVAAAGCLVRRVHRAAGTSAGLDTRLLRTLRAAQSRGAAVSLDEPALCELARVTIDSLARTLAFRLTQAHLAHAHGGRRTAGAALLQKALRDAEVEAREQLFLLLALLYPAEPLRRIHRELSCECARTRASSLELLDNIVCTSLRERVLVVVDEIDDHERLTRLGGSLLDVSYAELLGALRAEGGVLAELVEHHAAELGLADAIRVPARRSSSPPLALDPLTPWPAHLLEPGSKVTG